jgi:hypothetical protein
MNAAWLVLGLIGAGALFWGGQIAWLAFCIITFRDYPSGRKLARRKDEDDVPGM